MSVQISRNSGSFAPQKLLRQRNHSAEVVWMDHIDHVLIVDDDREIRDLVSAYLKKNGLRVTIAADGRQMRSFLDANRVDLIVLDIMMPGDDGLVLCRELRAGKHKTTPVLMLTARNDETDRVVGLEMGAGEAFCRARTPGQDQGSSAPYPHVAAQPVGN